MSHLPPDPAKWPDDPYKLFDVTDTVTRKELRRRYSQLIRQHKPEHAPEEFRRIRDAFEVLQQHAQWREQFAAWNAQQSAAGDDAAASEPLREATEPGNDEPGNYEPASAEPADDASHNSAVPGSSADAEAGRASNSEIIGAEPVRAEVALNAPAGSSSRKALDALIEDAWNVARAGDPPLAYQTLVELHQQHPGDEEICVRLYWLLVLWPATDARHGSADWLYAGLVGKGLSGRMAELLRSHFEDDPQAALDPRCEELLRRDAPAWQLVELAARRWQAAAGLGRADVVAADLRALSAQLRDETTREWWARALLAAAEPLAWMPGGAGGAVLEDCRRQLDELGEVQLSLSHELDRRDLLQELTAAFAALRPLTSATTIVATRQELAALERLLADWWRLPFHEVRSQAERTLHPWLVAPQRGLSFFDQLRQRCPVILSQLSDLVDAWHRHRLGDDEEPADQTAEHAAVLFFNQHLAWSFEQIRARLLSFCIHEWIWPRHLLKLWATFPPPANEWSASLDADAPLRCLSQAYEAAWG